MGGEVPAIKEFIVQWRELALNWRKLDLSSSSENIYLCDVSLVSVSLSLLISKMTKIDYVTSVIPPNPNILFV